MAAPRRAFSDLSSNLQEFVESGKDFQKITTMFFYFFKKIKEDIATKNKVADAARAMVLLEYIKAELEQISKSFGSIHHDYRTNTIPKMFEDMGIPKLPLSEGFTVEVKPRYFCTIKPGESEGAFDWLRSNQLGDIIKEQVNPRTLVSAVEELLETQGVEPPDKYFNAFQQAQAKVTKGRSSKTKIEKDFNPYEDLSGDE